MFVLLVSQGASGCLKVFLVFSNPCWVCLGLSRCSPCIAWSLAIGQLEQHASFFCARFPCSGSDSGIQTIVKPYFFIHPPDGTESDQTCLKSPRLRQTFSLRSQRRDAAKTQAEASADAEARPVRQIGAATTVVPSVFFASVFWEKGQRQWDLG